MRALEHIRDDHLIPPYKRELFTTATDAKDQVQDYAFSQEFAIVTHNHDKTCQIVALKSTQHWSHTKNWRETPLEERKRIDTKDSANENPFRLCIKQKKDRNVWRMVKLCLDHNHLMNPDPFQF